ncbi:MAG: hypothetical protein UX13_C0034G0012 [Candidatus Woesebacteria bacterium GW2011_GWB1_45_5]|uniref:UDP-N-acetylglucosamine--N-acetylmuramyl-(pentapeptide) pyrophosphoryl-undecaprenol N-acetylglucosamine transferase n=1 Tax=Candidatus Woesebacteria bacterium GW2011_GWB1_45_5 TaxID=1618581 RepID=A0A0G1QM04_9BACT|nr:MAG: hypothetical protein UX13_C0034G0012 [Candidatus Woesebacteria bacterium GW2011_GWB1_45_5]
MNIILTGGHAATTAVAVVEEIISRKKPWKLFFIGARSAIEGKNIATLESEVMPRLGVEFLPLSSGRLQRKFTRWTIPALFRTPFGIFQSFYYLLKHSPKAVLSFGGYTSFPVVFTAWLLRIPVVLHEQTAAAGRANIASAKFASKITLAREESLQYFPLTKSVVTGNPVMRDIAKTGIKKEISRPSSLFVTGGSRGSQSINEVLEKCLTDLLSKHKVCHQTGDLDFARFSHIKSKLPPKLSANYQIFPRIDPLKISETYKSADVVISRAGANTVSEIISLKRPAILVPLPISYLDEQTKNAEFARSFGLAVIIPQKDLTAKRLVDEIDNVFLRLPEILKKAEKKEIPDRKAAQVLVDVVAKFVK